MLKMPDDLRDLLRGRARLRKSPQEKVQKSIDAAKKKAAAKSTISKKSTPKD